MGAWKRVKTSPAKRNITAYRPTLSQILYFSGKGFTFRRVMFCNEDLFHYFLTRMAVLMHLTRQQVCLKLGYVKKKLCSLPDGISDIFEDSVRLVQEKRSNRQTFTSKRPNVLVKWLALLIHIWEVPGSNLARRSAEVFVVFFSLSRQMSG